MLVKTESVDMTVGEQSSNRWARELVPSNVKKTFHQRKYYRNVLNSLYLSQETFI